MHRMFAFDYQLAPGVVLNVTGEAVVGYGDRRVNGFPLIDADLINLEIEYEGAAVTDLVTCISDSHHLAICEKARREACGR